MLDFFLFSLKEIETLRLIYFSTTAPFLCCRADADLGKFSEAIYKKMLGDAKRQSFQGFRPGTIPPHLEPTYRAFTMDECARETVMEAMQQNNIRPFSDARMDLTIHEVCIPPPVKKNTKKKSKKRKSKQDPEPEVPVVVEETPEWLTFESMKEAIDAGWRVSRSNRLYFVKWL
jgi:hypothetical protein